MKLTIGFIALLALLVACDQEAPVVNEQSTQVPNTESVSVMSESQRLNEWFERRFEERLQRSPMYLTQLGRKDKYDQIDEASEEALDEQLQWQGETVADLKSSFDYSALSEDAKISYDIWVYQYESARAMAPFRRQSYVFTQMLGPHTSLASFLINFHRVDEDADMEAYISRIGGISTRLSQLLERAKLSAAQNVRPPQFAYEAVISESRALLTGAPFEENSQDDSPIFADAKGKIEGLLEGGKIDGDRATELLAQVEEALLAEYSSAYSDLITWFENDFENADEIARGVGSLENGVAFYNARLLSSTTTQLSAEEIHNIGLQEVARIQAEMEKIKDQVGFEGSLQEFFVFNKTDERFFYPNDDEGRQGYINDSRDFLEAIKSKLPEYFGLLPKADLEVKRVEAFREQDGAPQHYFSGTPDGSRPGVYYAHLSDMSSMPNNVMETIAYHEGNPGHHMQISIAQELEGVPEFRKQAGFTSYVEGWGLYAETLAKDMGAYQDPYKDFGRLTGEIWRAIRLVVDTGIHSKDWSEEQAVDYFQDNSPIAIGQIRAEVRRYIVWPGQATAYKIGMLKFIELRDKAKAELGDKFDIRTFHDTVLGGGSVPLGVLERIVDNWIAETVG